MDPVTAIAATELRATSLADPPPRAGGRAARPASSGLLRWRCSRPRCSPATRAGIRRASRSTAISSPIPRPSTSARWMPSSSPTPRPSSPSAERSVCPRKAGSSRWPALQESTLHNLPYGDRDSIGLFQQRDAWGSRADRLNPVTTPRCSSRADRRSARPASIPDYLTLPVTRRPGRPGQRLPRRLRQMGRPGSSARRTPASPAPPARRSLAAGGSKVVEVALTQLGVPYSWGGGTLTVRLGFGPGASPSASTAPASPGTSGTKPRESRCPASPATKPPPSSRAARQLRAGDLSSSTPLATHPASTTTSASTTARHMSAPRPGDGGNEAIDLPSPTLSATR